MMQSQKLFLTPQSFQSVLGFVSCQTDLLLDGVLKNGHEPLLHLPSKWEDITQTIEFGDISNEQAGNTNNHLSVIPAFAFFS